MKSNIRKLCQIGFGVLILVFIDQWTKQLAIKYLQQHPKVLIPGVLEFNYCENHGAAFGILQNKQIFLWIITILLLAVIGFCYFRIRPGKFSRALNIIFIVLTAGAIGNFIDRILRGYVVDFIYFRLIQFPVFNIADCYVTISAAVLIIIVFLDKENELDFFSRRKE